MILTALNDYYERLVERGEDVAPYGFSEERISYALVLDLDGRVRQVRSIMDVSGKKPVPATLLVPQPPKRTAGINPAFLWDKSSYVLGLTGKTATKDIDRAQRSHEAFVRYHKQCLEGVTSDVLRALLRFFETWELTDPSCRDLIPIEALDANFVIQLDGERRYAHECEEAIDIWRSLVRGGGGHESMCLVTGGIGQVATLHPAIKGVNGAQSSGASIVSFNLDAATSYGKKQGGNAPVSERAAFAYTSVLNHLLRRDSNNRHRLQIGDATVVFWAEAEDDLEVDAGELLISALMAPSSDANESSHLKAALSQVAKGRPLRELGANLSDATKIFVLGLAPNASRLSIRFWETTTLDAFVKRLAQHYADLELVPLPWKTEPAIWRLLLETVPHRAGSKPKLDDVSPHLAGELTRAVLTGGRYPRSMLANLIMRMRADGDVSPLRVALCKAVLVRDSRVNYRTSTSEGIPVSLDIENGDSGYVLGRLFALLEYSQGAALGANVNATIRDRYYGAASATPASVFPMLLRNLAHHLGKVRKDKPGLAVSLEKRIGEVVDLLGPTMPKSLPMEAQGRFAIGYFHQNRDLFTKSSDTRTEGEQ